MPRKNPSRSLWLTRPAYTLGPDGDLTTVSFDPPYAGAIVGVKLGDSLTQMKAVMGEWMVWFNAHKADIVDMGDGLGRTRRVDASGNSDMKNGVTAYTTVKADSFDAAVKLFDKHPHLSMKGTWIEVMQCAGMQEMGGQHGGG